jgi:DNA mismatch repair protein MutS
MSKSSEDASPVRRQYLDIKRKYRDEILFFRLGDFYETFDEDAEKAARALDIVLTERNVGKGARVPMAGIPFHAAENYIARLIEQGYHVAICEQIGDQPSKGIFPRKVVRVVTPGTLFEPGLLPGDENNYLAAVVLDGRRAGIAYVDITTGEFSTTELEGERVAGLLRAELQRLHPAEILLPEETELPGLANGHLTTLPAWRFEAARCEDALKRHFGTGTLDGFGL